MSFFTSPQEVDCYVGGILRLAVVHPDIGPRLAEPGVVLGIRCTDPDARFVMSLKAPVTVSFDEDVESTDVEIVCPADVLDGVFRGRTSLLDALATGTATARGRISKVLKLLPVLEQVFPVYRDLVATKEHPGETLAELSS